QGDIELSNEHFPFSIDMDIHRVALEMRPGGTRLVVEFVAFAPGVLELPPFEIAGQVFDRIAVDVSSVLGPSEVPVLSPPAMPLAVPGTALLVYGTIAVLVLLLLLVSLVSGRGRAWIRGMLAAWRRRRMLSLMLGIERRLRKALAKGAETRDVLDTLSGEFRGFLTDLTGQNCRAMTAVEIGRLDIHSYLAPGTGDTGSPGTEFLGGFFGRCDGIRFSGHTIGMDETVSMLDDLRDFVLALARAPAGQAETGAEPAVVEAA
ncbi:MAG: hypothetical protein FWD88_07260, partial [Treponema sp.]|nr:hypothetical protein [Treponema sp.]